MRLLAFAILLSVACKSGGDEPPGTGPNGGSDADRAGHDSPSEDRDQPAVKSAGLTLQVQIDGATSTWGREAFERVPRLTGRNRSGESRDAWSLRAMAAEMVGPGARVISVTGDGASREISAEEWKDTTRTPILHTTRRGTLKFRWVEGDGEWQEEAAVRDVTGLAVTDR